mgnify:CR=1 FL=1
MGTASILAMSDAVQGVYTPTVTPLSTLTLANVSASGSYTHRPGDPYVIIQGHIVFDWASNSGKLTISLPTEFPADDSANRYWPIPMRYYAGTGAAVLTYGEIDADHATYGQSIYFKTDITANTNHVIDYFCQYPLKGYAS